MTDIQTRRFSSKAGFDAALVQKLELAIATPDAAIMLAGGRTPLAAYNELAQRQPRPAQGLHLLYSDDRYVPSTSDSSNYYQSRALVNALALPEAAVLRVRTELPLEQAATDYEQKLTALWRDGHEIALGLLGLGADGHTASLFNAGHLVEARGRLAIPVQRPDGMQGVSVTPDVLARVRELIFLVTGADKHAVIEAFLRSDSDLTARKAVAGCPRVGLWTAS
ncbi:MAG TPA: 6-phosphogluconolactonase [Steroidobacteraceae bacterium]|nr:6-phosphogluconolactonase [Steroidobacteraceae bacterium]